MSDETPDPGMTGEPLGPLDPDVAAWLAAAPAPPMPPEVWARIEGALAAEPPFTPTGEAPLVAAPLAAPGSTPPPVADLAERRERHRGGRLLPVLAGAAGLVLVGAVVIPAMRAQDGPAPVAEGNGGQPAVVAQPSPERQAPLPRMMMSSGTDYASAQMPEQVTPLLATAGITDAASVATMSTTAPLDVTPIGSSGFTSTDDSLADCMGKLGMEPDGLAPLLIDRATFDGADVGVVVMVDSPPAADEPAVLDVVVVGSDCTDDDVASAQRFEVTVAP